MNKSRIKSYKARIHNLLEEEEGKCYSSEVGSYNSWVAYEYGRCLAGLGSGDSCLRIIMEDGSGRVFDEYEDGHWSCTYDEEVVVDGRHVNKHTRMTESEVFDILYNIKGYIELNCKHLGIPEESYKLDEEKMTVYLPHTNKPEMHFKYEDHKGWGGIGFAENTKKLLELDAEGYEFRRC